MAADVQRSGGGAPPPADPKQPVRIVHQDGRFATVPLGNLASAEKLGWRVEGADDTAERRKGTVLQATAEGLGAGVVGGAIAAPKLITALGSAALGTEDPLARFSGRAFLEDVASVGAHLTGGESEVAGRLTREQLQADAVAHPYATLGGEIAGNVIGGAALGRGAVGLSGRAAGALGLTGRAAQIATGVGTGILEGGAIGADAASEQAWLRGEKATAEQSLASIGLGALLGGGASLGLAGASKLAQVARARLGRGAVEAAEVVPGAVEGAVTAAPSKVARPALETAGETMGDRARRYVSGLADDEAVAAVTRGNQPALKRLGLGGKAPTEEARRAAGQILHETGIVGGGLKGSSAESMLERAGVVAEESGQKIGQIMKRLDAEAPYVDAKGLISKLDDEIAAHRSSLNSWEGPEGERVADFLDARVQRLRELDANGILTHSELHQFRRYVDKLSKWNSAAPSAEADALRKLRPMVEEGVEEAIDRGSANLDADLLAEYQRAKEVYKTSNWAEDALAERVNKRDVANRAASLTDYMAAATGFAVSGGSGLSALALGAANKAVRERGSSIFSQVARKLAGESVDLARAPAAVMPAARGIHATVARTEEHIGESLAKALSGTLAPRAARVGLSAALRSGNLETARAAYQDHAKEVNLLAAAPDVAASRFASIAGDALPAYAPAMHAQMAAIATKGVQYLASTMPGAARDPDSITPHLYSRPPVSESDLAMYAERYEGVTDPLSLMTDLASGYVSPEKVEAVSTVWAQLYTRMRENLFAQLHEQNAEVPFYKRLLLEQALGGSGQLEPSMRSDSLYVMQSAGRQALAQAQQQQRQQRQQGPRGELAAGLATRTERIMKG